MDFDTFLTILPILVFLVGLTGLMIAIAKNRSDKRQLTIQAQEKEYERQQKEYAQAEVDRQAEVMRLENAHKVSYSYDPVNFVIYLVNNSPRIIRDIKFLEGEDISATMDAIISGRTSPFRPTYIFLPPRHPLSGKKIQWTDYDDKIWVMTLGGA